MRSIYTRLREILFLFFIFTILNNNSLFSEELSWKPDFLIIGAAKSGTTQLINCLIQHPLIEGPVDQKEVHFLTFKFNKGFNWYRSRFAQRTSQNQLFGEKSPSYLSFPQAPQRAFALFPNLKIIVILRNPIDRAYSQYQMLRRGGKETLATFEEALENELTRTGFKKYGLPSNLSLQEEQAFRWFGYVSRSIYVDQIAEWLKFFPKNQIHVIDSRDLLTNMDQTVNEVFTFLGVPEFHDIHCKESLKNSYPPMNPDTRAKLSAFFAPYNRELEQLLGKQFNWD